MLTPYGSDAAHTDTYILTHIQIPLPSYMPTYIQILDTDTYHTDVHT